MQHIYFLKEKNKRAAPAARTKTHAKKDVGKLNNIMNLIVFFSPAHVRQNTGAEHALKKIL
jgi:hypothetical protein